MLEDWNKLILFRETFSFRSSNSASGILEFSGNVGGMSNSTVSPLTSVPGTKWLQSCTRWQCSPRKGPLFLCYSQWTFRHNAGFGEISMSVLEMLSSVVCRIAVSVSAYSEMCTPAECSSMSHTFLLALANDCQLVFPYLALLLCMNMTLNNINFTFFFFFFRNSTPIAMLVIHTSDPPITTASGSLSTKMSHLNQSSVRKTQNLLVSKSS